MMADPTGSFISKDDDDDSRSVRSSATTSSRIGGFLKNKLHQTASFSVPRLRKQRKDMLGPHDEAADADEDDEQYHENEATLAAATTTIVLREKTNTMTMGSPGKSARPNSGGDAEETAKLRAKLRELQSELAAEKVKTQQLEADQEMSRKRTAELRSALERERENYHSLLSGAGVDEAVRMQAETIQELQALSEALQLRVEQVQTDLNESEQRCESLEQSSKAEKGALVERVQRLEAENASLKKQAAAEQKSSSDVKSIEKERDALRQRVLALEAEATKSLKRTDSGSSAEKIKMLEAENAELKRGQANEVKAQQSKIFSLESALKTATSRKGSDGEVAALQARLSEKEAELASLASGAEQELARLEANLQTEQKRREDSEAAAKSMEQELINVKVELSRQQAYWKEKLEHDEHYQRAAEAARQLLKQKKITKAEYDQVMKAAQEASRVWVQ